MNPKNDIQQYRKNWQEEQEAAFLYEKMAATESNPEIAAIYRRLAETEARHARLWEERLLASGASLPKFQVTWRVRWLAFLAAHFGNALILPTLATNEKKASTNYDGQPEAEAAGLPQDERSHARMFSYLAQSSRGLEGNAIARLEGRHRATAGNALRAGVLGANDGLVSNFSLVMGVAGAELSGGSVLVTGLAGLLAGAISMALGEWLSVKSSRELYENQIRIEKQELETAPEEEKEELALIYQAKGLPVEEAHTLAQRLLLDPSQALDTLAREELGIDPKELGGSAWEAAGASFFLFAAGAIIPVLPFFFLHGMNGVLVSAAVSTLGLFGIGAGITLVTGKSLWFSGLRQISFGLIAALITYFIGKWIGTSLL